MTLIIKYKNDDKSYKYNIDRLAYTSKENAIYLYCKCILKDIINLDVIDTYQIKK